MALLLRALAQHAEDRRHLAQDRLTRTANVIERLARLRRVGVEQVPRDPRLDRDDRDMVRDDVMQLTGDVQPLLYDAALRLLLSAGLCARCTPARCRDDGPLRAHSVTDRGRQPAPRQ